MVWLKGEAKNLTSGDVLFIVMALYLFCKVLAAIFKKTFGGEPGGPSPSHAYGGGGGGRHGGRPPPRPRPSHGCGSGGGGVQLGSTLAVCVWFLENPNIRFLFGFLVPGLVLEKARHLLWVLDLVLSRRSDGGRLSGLVLGI